MIKHPCRHPRAIRAVLLILLMVLVICRDSPCFAGRQQASIEDFFVTNSETDLLLYLKVRGGFTPELEAGVQNGISATFIYYVELYQPIKGWPDRKLASHTFQHTLAYDNLKEQYVVAFAPEEKKITTSSLAEARRCMSEINGCKVIASALLTPDTPYLLRVKMKLASRSLPRYLHYLLPFSSLWDFETGWYSLQFRY